MTTPAPRTNSGATVTVTGRANMMRIVGDGRVRNLDETAAQVCALLDGLDVAVVAAKLHAAAGSPVTFEAPGRAETAHAPAPVDDGDFTAPVDTLLPGELRVDAEDAPDAT